MNNMNYDLEAKRKIKKLESENEKINNINQQGEELQKEAEYVNNLEFKIRKQIAAIGATISLGVCFGILCHSIAAKIDEQQYRDISTKKIVSYDTLETNLETLRVGAEELELDYSENNSNFSNLSDFINEDGTINIKRILVSIYTIDFCTVFFIIIGILESIKKTKMELAEHESLKVLEERIHLIKQEYDNKLREIEELKNDLIQFIMEYNDSIIDKTIISESVKLIRTCN